MATASAHPKQSPAGTAELLQQTVHDIEQVTESASGDMRRNLEDAVARMREVAGDLRARAEDQAAEFERTIDEVSEDVRRELGRRSVRAQRSPEALSEMSAEIRRRRSQLARAAKAAESGKA